MDKRVMHIFYKDLNFHSALVDAANKQQVLPVFLWSEHLNQDVDTTPSLIYRWQWATLFNQQLLPADVNMPIVENSDDIVAICQNFAIDEVTMLRHFEPREIAFQKQLALELKAHGVRLKLFDIYRLNNKLSVVNRGKDIDFVNYYANWKKQAFKREAVAEIAWISIDLGNRYQKMPFKVDMQSDFNAYQAFLAGELTDMTAQAINTMVNHGIINARSVYNKLVKFPESKVKQSIIYNLCYRDFAYAVVEKTPSIIDTDYKQNDNQWLNSALDYQFWCKGETGQPELDQALKTLYQTGRMNGKMRFLAARYLTKELKVCWQEGVFWFKEHLLDYDLAINSLAWQWVAKTGIDARALYYIIDE